MATDYREDNDLLEVDFETDDDRVPENRVRELDPESSPAAIGVYDRPEKNTGSGLSVAAIVGILALLVIAYYVLTTLF